MAEHVSVFRLNLLRSIYTVNFALVGSGVVVAFIQRQDPWSPIVGVAYSFWAAFALLSALGLRYPLAMLPLLFVQLLYKTFWLLSVYFPLRAADRSSDMALPFLIVVALDVIVIPWSYAFAQYVVRPGDVWRSNRREPQPTAPAL
jgi:hypothetical protein